MSEGAPVPFKNWNEELKGEAKGQSFWYSVGNDPEKARKLVTAAVYQSLSGQDIYLREKNSLIAGSSFIRNEQTEITARGLMDSVRHLREENGYEDEWEEAKSQGDRAVQNVNEKRPWSVHYGYWAMIPVKSVLNLKTVPAFPGHYFFSCDLPELYEMAGLPQNIFSREYKGSAANSPLGLFLDISARFGSSPEDLLQGTFNRQLRMCFVQAMNDVGHTYADEKRKAIADPLLWEPRPGDRTYTSEQLWKMLSREEQALAQNPRQANLNCEIEQILTSGSSAATLRFTLWINGDVFYNPKTHSMGGTITPDGNEVLYARLSPSLSPNIDHAEFLEIRRQTENLANELGFPNNQRVIW